MPIQLSYDDDFKRSNPQAYLRLEAGTWKYGSGGLQMTARIYASKAAADAGGKPLLEFDRFVPYDTTSLTGGIEQFFMSQEPLVSAGHPTQVA